MPLKARAKRQQGSVLIAALVLIALLFFIETALAAAVSSTLHSVRVIDSQAGVRYAAESAAARGIAGELNPNPTCPSGAAINGITSSTTCFRLAGIQANPSAVQQWGTADQTLGAAGCSVTSLPASGVSSGETEPGSITFWTVLAWRGAGSSGLTVWIDGNQTCGQQSGVCPGAGGQASPPSSFRSPGVANFLAVTCPDADTHYYLHVVNSGGQVEVGQFVVRGTLLGSDSALIAVGAADTELDEAEVLLPATPSPGVPPTQDLWDTLLR
jgi:hypothetical protein